MKKILLAFLFTILATTMFAQEKKLLNDFKYRIDNFRAVQFNAGGGSGYARANFIPNISRYQSTTFGGGLGASFFNLKSTDRILQTINAGLNTSANFSKNTNFNMY